MIVAPLGSEIARPFAEGACERYGVRYDADTGHDMLWWGGIERFGVRAVVGWAEFEPGTLLLVGPFGDGSFLEDSWMNDLLMSMSTTGARFVVIPASPSLYIRRQSVQLERYGTVRTPRLAKAS